MIYSKLNFILYLIFACSVISCKKTDRKKIYEVKPANKIQTDNLMEDKIWGDANVLSDFCLPWDKRSAQETRFKALFDETYLYFIFYSKDSNLVVLENIPCEQDIAKEDRVEIYFSYSGLLDEYYCIEVDPYGRVLDYKARYYRNFDMKWNVNQLIVESKITNVGFNVAMAIPWKDLEKMKINNMKHFYVGLFRADLQNTKNGIKENWISWVNPGTKSPDFHLPGAFGFFYCKYRDGK